MPENQLKHLQSSNNEKEQQQQSERQKLIDHRRRRVVETKLCGFLVGTKASASSILINLLRSLD
jgi:hypothetical protein